MVEELKLQDWQTVHNNWSQNKPKNIRSATVTELKSLANPPEAVVKVCLGVSVLLEEPQKTWADFKTNIMNGTLLQRLNAFDPDGKSHLLESLKGCKKLVAAEVSKKSLAAGALC